MARSITMLSRMTVAALALVLTLAACQQSPEPVAASEARPALEAFVAQVAGPYGLDDADTSCVVDDMAREVGTGAEDLSSRDFRNALRSCDLRRGPLLADLGSMLSPEAATCLDDALTDDEVADIFDGGYLQEGPLGGTVTDLGDAALAYHPECAR